MLDSERDRIFSEWLADHKGILFKVVHAYAFEHADRQDLFQEIVFQVWRSVDAFRGESAVPTWMYRVALNTAIAWTRKEDRHQRGKQPLAVVEGLLTMSSSDGHDPRVEWLYRQIAQLQDVDRSVALLLLDGFSYKEIAAIVGITESNVGVKINRIKSALAGKPRAGLWRVASGPAQPAEIALIDPWLIDPWSKRVGRAKLMAPAMLALVASAALAFISARINEKPYDESWRPVVRAILVALIAGGVGRWWQRRSVRRDLAPRKRRLEALLKEFDG